MKDSSAKSTPYGRVAIALHWLIGLAIPAVFGLGLYMTTLPFSPAKLQYYSWHKWAGVTIFFLACLRLAWRLRRSTAPLAGAGASSWQDSIALWTHRTLYLLMLAIPLSGWLMSSAKGVPTVYFGVWQLPNLVDRDAQLGDQLQTLHLVLNYLMASIVLMHSAAALKHHLIDRDDVLVRMLPFLKIRRSNTL